MFDQNILDISSVCRSTLTHKSVSRVNVYGRDVTLDFQTIRMCILVAMQQRCFL